MSTNKDETLRQFCDVTGADETRSKFFLESSNWQLDVALSSFYEHGGNVDEAPAHPAVEVSSLPTLSDSDMESSPGSPMQAQKKDKKKAPNTKFATLGSLQQESSSDEEEVSKCGWIRHRIKMIVQQFFCTEPTCSKKLRETQSSGDNPCKEFTQDMSTQSQDTIDTEEVARLKREVDRLLYENCELRKEIARLKANGSDSETGQAFYAGGSERSGQQILGPSKPRKDIVTEMFKSVRERGAVVFEDEPSSTSNRGRSVFGGVGYRLGQTSDDHEPVTPSGGTQAGAGAGAGAGPGAGARAVRLRLYREGFTVDAGALRQYSDPEHADFLNSIRRGEIPSELSGSGGEVRVSLEDRRHEECPRDLPRPQAFTGKGQMLGSPTPPTVGATAAVASDVNDRAANQRAAQDAVNVDDAQPTTTIQFRLADGSRLTGRFNHSHTVADLARFVSRAEPAYQLAPFALLTAFPSAELADPAATLDAARLLNTTLLQRLK